MFLQQVKVKNFAESKKVYGTRYGGRKLYTYANENPNDIFNIIGVTSIKEGVTEHDGEYGYQFNQSKSHKVYIVAKSIGRRFKVLPEDIELVGEPNVQS
ncbi:hypothetical protein LSPCS325_09200 [Lysinibacillus sp. CTST325]